MGIRSPMARASGARRADRGRLVSLQPLQHADAALDRADVRGRARGGARARNRIDMTTENRQPDPTMAPGEPRGAQADERAQGDMEPAAPAAPFDPSDVIKHLTHKPGVYRMLDAAGEVIYVGKARDLRKRVDELFPRQPRARRQDHRDGAHDRGHRGHGDAHRGRSADARVQPDQAAPAALQRRAARRQELSVHPARRRIMRFRA